MSFSSYFSEQARKPSGLFGHIVMQIVFDRGNAFLNGFVNEIMAVQPNDRVLEIGCGTGKLVKMMAKRIDNGLIEGIDFSSTMVEIAQRRNRKNIARGTVTIVEDDFDETTSLNTIFTKACSVNTVYFWKNPQHTVQKVINVLQPAGQLLLAFEDIDQLRKRKLNADVFKLYSKNDVARLLTNIGFSDVCIESREKRKLLFHCAVATKSA